MADPVTLLAIGSAVATVAGGAMQAVGQKNAADAQAKAARYQAEIARANSQAAAERADYTRQKGVNDASTQDTKTRALIGSQLAAQGASGLDVNSGSPLDIRSSSASLGRLDTLTVRHNAELQGQEYDQMAKNQTYQATSLENQGSSAKLAGYVGAAGSLLGTAASVSDKWMSYKQKGVF